MNDRKTSHTVRQMVKGSQHEQANERSEAEKIKAINELYAADEPESDNVKIMVANQGKIDKKEFSRLEGKSKNRLRIRCDELPEGSSESDTARGSANDEEQKEVDQETAHGGSNINDY